MSSSTHLQTADITPSPRILWVLGQIPFQPWQALAELIDNSIDAFLGAHRDGSLRENARIDVTWSSQSVAPENRVIEVSDNGRGIDLDTVQLAVRAGYTSNDPVSNLGLFGMGFNIATARLGGVTRFLSTKLENNEWLGIEIDFGDLAKRGSFSAPIVKENKPDSTQSGTKVIISKLNEGGFKDLRDRESQLRQTLEDVYAPILREKKIAIYINGIRLEARQYCTWDRTRAVVRDGQKIFSVIEIDKDIGSALFDKERNQYLPGSVEAEIRSAIKNGGSLPDNVIERNRRLRGWIGIQRYSDPNDFGIDFVRNGRKILIKDKRLFSWANPLSSEIVLEYPVELGTTVGGRIVGEVHVDYLVPTYQKNDFDRSEGSWLETSLALRGDGPILPKRRKAIGYSEANTSPIGLLANAYRRSDPGTRCLAIQNSTAREWARMFFKGNPSYQTDEKWWRTALEADQDKVDKGGNNSATVDSGELPTDEVETYGPSSQPLEPAKPNPTPKSTSNTPVVDKDSDLSSLLTDSTQQVTLTGEYAYGKSAPFKVRAYATTPPSKIIMQGKTVPCTFFQDANECDFFYDPNHAIIAEFPLAPRDLLTLYLAERFKARDHLSDLAAAFSSIYSVKFNDTRIERSALQDKAFTLVDDLRSRFKSHLSPVAEQVLHVIHESAGDVEELTLSLIHDSGLLRLFLNKDARAIGVIESVPERALPRLLERFPEYLMDNKVFTLPFIQIELPDEKATDRARTEARKRIQSYLDDVVSILTSNLSRFSKDELRRASLSLDLLRDCIVL